MTETFRHWDFFWMFGEMFKALFFLIFTMSFLYQKIGYACFLTWIFVGIKMGLDLYSRPAREKAEEKVSKASE